MLDLKFSVYEATKIWRKGTASAGSLDAFEDACFSICISRFIMKFLSPLKNEAIVHFTLSDLCWQNNLQAHRLKPLKAPSWLSHERTHAQRTHSLFLVRGRWHWKLKLLHAQEVIVQEALTSFVESLSLSFSESLLKNCKPELHLEAAFWSSRYWKNSGVWATNLEFTLTNRSGVTLWYTIISSTLFSWKTKLNLECSLVCFKRGF